MAKDGKLVFLILGLIISVGCSEGQVESERLTELQPILFDGKTAKELVVQNTLSAQVTASCDKTVTDIQISTSQSGPFTSIGNFTGITGSAMVETCRKSGTMTVDVLKSNMANFTKGTNQNTDLFFKAVSGNDSTAASHLSLVYKPPLEAPSPSSPSGYSTSLGSGEVTGPSLFKMRYKIGKPAPSLVGGSTFKIDLVNQ